MHKPKTLVTENGTVTMVEEMRVGRSTASDYVILDLAEHGLFALSLRSAMELTNALREQIDAISLKLALPPEKRQ